MCLLPYMMDDQLAAASPWTGQAKLWSTPKPSIEMKRKQMMWAVVVALHRDYFIGRYDEHLEEKY